MKPYICRCLADMKLQSAATLEGFVVEPDGTQNRDRLVRLAAEKFKSFIVSSHTDERTHWQHSHSNTNDDDSSDDG